MVAAQTAQAPIENAFSLLTAAQAAKQLQISVRTLQKRVATGELRCVKIGRVVRYRPADLAAFVNGSCSNHAS